MDDFNAELLKTQGRAEIFNLEERIAEEKATHERLRGATVEYHEVKGCKVGQHLAHCNQGEYMGLCKYNEDDTCPALIGVDPLDKERALEYVRMAVHFLDPDSTGPDRGDDRYMMHGILSRLQAVQDETHEAWSEAEAAGMYGIVVAELINTLQSYLSQG